MQLRQLQYVVALVQAGSVLEAARRESVSTAVLLGQIDRLEAALGVQLFHDLGDGVNLTSAGHIFVKKARSILNECAILTRGCRQSSRAFDSGGQKALATAEEVLSASGAGEAFDPGPALTTVYEGVVTDSRFVLVVALRHRLARSKAVSLSTLEDETLVSFANCERFSEAKRLLRERGIRPKVIYESHDYDRVINLIRAQVGIAIFPPLLACAGIVQIPFSDIELSDVHKLQ